MSTVDEGVLMVGRIVGWGAGGGAVSGATVGALTVLYPDGGEWPDPSYLVLALPYGGFIGFFYGIVLAPFVVLVVSRVPPPLRRGGGALLAGGVSAALVWPVFGQIGETYPWLMGGRIALVAVVAAWIAVPRVLG